MREVTAARKGGVVFPPSGEPRRGGGVGGVLVPRCGRRVGAAERGIECYVMCEWCVRVIAEFLGLLSLGGGCVAPRSGGPRSPVCGGSWTSWFTPAPSVRGRGVSSGTDWICV